MSITTQGIIEKAPVYTGNAEKHSVKQDEIETSWFSDWLNDKDKVCTDGKDDGSISFGEGLESFGKGLMGIVKGAINHPIATAVTVAAGVGLTVLTGGAALPVMIAAGAATGAGMIGYGAYKAATADTDSEAKQAWETIGNGTFALATSVAGAKPALNAASKAGVTTAQGAKNMNAFQATVQTFKSAPEALKMSSLNAKGNLLTWTSGNVHAHSNALQGAEPYMSKANDVQAYRFNPNGTPDEILANNPGVFRGSDGKYYLPNKWNPNEPYLIDTSKEQMIMLYGGDDMAVCDGAIFKGSYVKTSDFKANGALNYQDPANLQYGQVMDVTKQAPGAFKVMPEGTKIQTLKGTRTVQQGEVVAIDHAGNPYATTPKNILKRNSGFSDKAIANLSKVDPVAVELQKNPGGLLSEVPQQYRRKALSIMAEQKAKYAGFSDDYINARINAQVKEEVLNEMGVKIIFADNVYQGGDPIVGFMYNGKQYALKTHHHYDIDGIFEQITTGNIQSQEFVSPAELGFGRFYIKEAGGKSNFLN